MFFFSDCGTNGDSSRNRNWHSHVMEKYNCAGFALGTFDWFYPYDESIYDCMDIRDDDHMYEEHLINDTTDYMTKFMLTHIAGMRVIDLNNYKLEQEETIVLFRLSSSREDFHFMLKYKDKYIHKMGWAPWIEVEDDKFAEDQNESWYGYDGPIVAFARKVDWNLYEEIEKVLPEGQEWAFAAS